MCEYTHRIGAEDILFVLRKAYPEISELQVVPVQAFRQNDRLRDWLVRSKFRTSTVDVKHYFWSPKGSYPCLTCTQYSLVIIRQEFYKPNLWG